jgi:hypothetical protein
VRADGRKELIALADGYRVVLMRDAVRRFTSLRIALISQFIVTVMA